MASSRRRTIHGVLVEVSGVGVLLLGDSGTGKTQCAMDLIAAGHRLVADDVVEINSHDSGLIGNAPDQIRGIVNSRPKGFLDVRNVFGPNAVAETAKIDIVVRIGFSRGSFEEILGIAVPIHDFELTTDGNLASFVASVALGHLRSEM